MSKLIQCSLYAGCLIFFMGGAKSMAQVKPKIVTPYDAAQMFVGKGVGIDTIYYRGDTLQIGSFTFPNTNIGITKGVILASGDIRDAKGPNNHTGWPPSSTVSSTSADPDLNRLSQKLYHRVPQDNAVLTLVFKALGDTAEFEFVFASEEYREYALSQYTDLFCLLMKGPGIQPDTNANGTNFYATGPYKNLALINDSAISVRSINHINNSSFYNDYPVTSINSADTLCQFDGFTSVIKVKQAVACNNYYTLKIGIADIGDATLDSWVVLKGESFGSEYNVGEITADSVAKCAGKPIHLHIDGDDELRYLWNSEVVGKDYTIHPDSTGQEYTCVITDTVTGCSINKHYKVGKIYTSENTAPYTKGVNNNQFYEEFIKAGQQLCFDVTGYDNQNNELVNMTWDFGIGGNASFTGDYDNKKKNPKNTFCWTPSTSDIGIHKFKVFLRDDNPCSIGRDTSTFIINVICPNCPLDLLIENRRKGHNQLPQLTAAARWIAAGNSVDPSSPDGPVIVGKYEKVAFWAGKEIDLQPGFEVQDSADFTAEIKPVCLVEAFCDTCCVGNDNQIHINGINNLFSPDGDGINDVWQVFDTDHPGCAYNITGFRLNIFDRWGQKVFRQEGGDGNMSCCKFTSPSAFTDNTSVASIHWDGRYNVPANSTDKACCGKTYFAVLEMTTCNGNTEVVELNMQAFASIKPVRKNDSLTGEEQYMDTSLKIAGKKIEDIELDLQPDDIINLMIYPNPSQGLIDLFIVGWNENKPESIVNITDAEGRQVYNATLKTEEKQLNLSQFASGIYSVSLMYKNRIKVSKLVLETH